MSLQEEEKTSALNKVKTLRRQLEEQEEAAADAASEAIKAKARKSRVSLGSTVDEDDEV